jgi:hypothetical protein
MQARTAIAVTAIVSGVAAILLAWLLGQGLDRAEKWVSIVGVVIAVAFGVASLLLERNRRRHAKPSNEATIRGEAVSRSVRGAQSGVRVDGALGGETVDGTARARVVKRGGRNVGVTYSPNGRARRPRP